MKARKLKLTVSVDPSSVHNELHFEVQRKTRMNIFRDRTKYSRKRKHKNLED